MLRQAHTMIGRHLKRIEMAIEKYEQMAEEDRHKPLVKERIELVLDKMEKKEAKK